MELQGLDLLAVDVQTTGASPFSGSMLEVGWQRLSSRGDGPVRALPVRIPSAESVPPRIRRLTGISPRSLGGREPTPAEVWWILSAAGGGVRAPEIPLLAHYSAFESRWLSHAAAVAGAGTPPAFICTRELARRLMPGLPGKGLRPVAGHLGLSLDRHRRAAGHVRATAFVWRLMLPMLESRGVTTLEGLLRFLRQPAPEPGSRRMALDRSVLSRLYRGPGVYRLLAADGRVLYVGKATSLRSRVSSYFAPGASGEKALSLASQTSSVEATDCGTPLAAALLEACEIHRHDPPYNSAIRPRSEPPLWASRDLLHHSESPGPGRLGPFPRSAVIGDARALVRSLLRGRATSGLRKSVRRRMGHGFTEVGPAQLEEGLFLLRQGLGMEEEGAEQAALALLDAGEERLAETATGDSGEEATRPGPAEPEDVRNALLGIAASAARAVLLGKLCCLLGDCRLAWSSPRWSGELCTSGWKPGAGWPDGVPATVPPGLRCRLAEVAAGEIRRVLREGGRLSLEPEDGPSLPIGELRRIVCAEPLE